MLRAAFHSKALVNRLAPDAPVAHTLHVPSDTVMPLSEAAQRHRDSSQSVVLVADQRYGTGSSRDWAAEGQRRRRVSIPMMLSGLPSRFGDGNTKVASSRARNPLRRVPARSNRLDHAFVIRASAPGEGCPILLASLGLLDLQRGAGLIAQAIALEDRIHASANERACVGRQTARGRQALACCLSVVAGDRPQSYLAADSRRRRSIGGKGVCQSPRVHAGSRPAAHLFPDFSASNQELGLGTFTRQ